MTIQVKLFDPLVDYDGSQLSSLFAYRTAGMVGDSVIAFRGSCEVGSDTMVDVEDVLAGAAIRSPDMVHFIVEHFGVPLSAMVLWQRIFSRLAADTLAERCGRAVRVSGDDVFVGDAKASISVATASPVSALFHFAFNIRTEGVPVKAIGLCELSVPWRELATDLMARYQAEFADVRIACAKVRWVQ